MIVCDRFVFLHLHKSGGTFVNKMIMHSFPEARLLGFHLPFAYLPQTYRRLPILGTVRNPWAFYVSWYHFQEKQAQPNAVFLVCSNNRRYGFEETMRNVVTLSEDDDRIDALVRALPEAFPNNGLNLTKSCIARIRGSGFGLYSFLYARHYDGAGRVSLLKVEHLKTQLRAFLENNQITNPAAMQFIEQTPPLNTTRHKPYPEYYSPELAELVRQRDALVIERHDYRF